MTYLNNIDRQVLNEVEIEAASGHTQNALLRLNLWRDSVERGKEKLAVDELNKAGVLPVLSVEKLKEQTEKPYKISVDKQAVAGFMQASGDPIDKALAQTAFEGMNHGFFNAPTGFGGKRYEDPTNLTNLQKDIEEGRPAEKTAYALMQPDAKGKTLYDKLAGTDGNITEKSIKHALEYGCAFGWLTKKIKFRVFEAIWRRGDMPSHMMALLSTSV